MKKNRESKKERKEEYQESTRVLFHGTVTFNELRMEVVKCNFVEITPI